MKPKPGTGTAGGDMSACQPARPDWLSVTACYLAGHCLSYPAHRTSHSGPEQALDSQSSLPTHTKQFPKEKFSSGFEDDESLRPRMFSLIVSRPGGQTVLASVVLRTPSLAAIQFLCYKSSPQYTPGSWIIILIHFQECLTRPPSKNSQSFQCISSPQIINDCPPFPAQWEQTNSFAWQIISDNAALFFTIQRAKFTMECVKED